MDKKKYVKLLINIRGTQRQFSENICSDDDLRSRIFGTFFVKLLACLPLLGAYGKAGIRNPEPDIIIFGSPARKSEQMKNF